MGSAGGRPGSNLEMRPALISPGKVTINAAPAQRIHGLRRLQKRYNKVIPHLRPRGLCACAQLVSFCPLAQTGGQKKGNDTGNVTSMVDTGTHWLKHWALHHTWVPGLSL